MISKSLIQKRLLRIRELAKKSSNLRAFSTSESEPKVLFNKHSDYVSEFILNKPKVLNSLDYDMINILYDKLREWNSSVDAPKVVFIKGTGEKAFCAGGDIKSIYEDGFNGKNPSTPKEFFAKEYIVDYGLANMKPIQITVWNGIVMGGGVGVSVHSPIRIATEKSVFAMPETGIGFFTDVGGGYFLSHVKNHINYGLYLGITGFRLKAKDLLKWGVATHYIDTSKIPDLYSDIISKTTSSSTFEEIKSIVDSHSDSTGIDDDFNAAIDYCFKPDSIHDIKKRLEDVSAGKVEGQDKAFAEKTLQSISKYSPLSCAVVVEQIKRGSKMTLADVFKMEYGISQAFMENGEFYEGVRALLIDRDNNPKWKHASLDEVTDKDVEFFFDRKEQLDLDITKDFRHAITYKK